MFMKDLVFCLFYYTFYVISMVLTEIMPTLNYTTQIVENFMIIILLMLELRKYQMRLFIMLKVHIHLSNHDPII